MVADERSSSSSSSVISSPLQCFSQMPLPVAAISARELRSDDRGLCLIHLLLTCAAHVAAGRIDLASAAMEHINVLASPDGDAMQRVAAYFAEALARRALRAWRGLYGALLQMPHATPSAAEEAAARRHFVDLCPFLRFAAVAANQAILEAMEGERVVHIIDFGAADPGQWVELLQLLAARPEGPPHLRITSVHEKKELLAHASLCLTKEAERLDVPFQFNAVVSRLENVDVDSLRVKTGEALAISSVLQLHRLLALDDERSTESSSSPRGTGTAAAASVHGFLTMLWRLSPKIALVTEQEASHNGAGVGERFLEALNYYAALFDCLELSAPRRSPERAMVERWLLGEEIRNIVGSEGVERRERHERLERWAARMEAAGFGCVPMSYYGMVQVGRMLQGVGFEGYKVREERGCFLVSWQDRPIFSVSAWRPRML